MKKTFFYSFDVFELKKKIKHFGFTKIKTKQKKNSNGSKSQVKNKINIKMELCYMDR
jgi:hypothetical protein